MAQSIRLYSLKKFKGECLFFIIYYAQTQIPKKILRKTNPSVQNSESPKTRFSIKMIKMIKINTEMFILFTIII